MESGCGVCSEVRVLERAWTVGRGAGFSPSFLLMRVRRHLSVHPWSHLIIPQILVFKTELQLCAGECSECWGDPGVLQKAVCPESGQRDGVGTGAGTLGGAAHPGPPAALTQRRPGFRGVLPEVMLELRSGARDEWRCW